MNHSSLKIAIAAFTTFIPLELCPAQCVTCHQILYDASTGLPSTTCFNSIAGPAAAAVVGNTLVLSSTSTTFSYDAIGIFPFRWSDGLKLQFRIRVPQGSYAYSPGPGFRAGALVVVHDSDNYTYGVAVWSDGAAFSNHWNLNPVSGGFSTISLDSTQDFHTFTVVANSLGAQFIVDGVPTVWLPAGATSTFNAPYFDFGIDSRYSGPTISEWKYVQLTLNTPCPGDLDCDLVVGDSDFSIFAHAYELLACDDPDMPLTCPADLNNDGVVDDGDFQIFVIYYNQLTCS